MERSNRDLFIISEAKERQVEEAILERIFQIEENHQSTNIESPKDSKCDK